MNAAESERHLRQLGALLAVQGLLAEILLVGDTAMTLVLRPGAATTDVAAVFVPADDVLRQAADRIAAEQGLPKDWLDGAVKGFLGRRSPTTVWLACPGLRLSAPDPAYVFARKTVAGRSADVRDLPALCERLGLTSAEQALVIVGAYVPPRLLPPNIRLRLQECLDDATP